MSKLLLVAVLMLTAMQPAVAQAENDELADLDADSLRVLARQLQRIISDLRGEIAALEGKVEAMASTAEGQSADDGESSPHLPDYQAFRFEYNRELSIRDSVVDAVEFTNQRCNIDLRNKTGRSSEVDVQVRVYNRDGVTLWAGDEHWIVTNLGVEDRHIASVDFDPSMPPSLRHSRYADDFDAEPYWFIVWREGQFRGSPR